MRLTLTLVVAAAASRVALLAAQCPDGTPPPCARAPGASSRAVPGNSIAVLYFDNLSRDSADSYLADGLTDEIIVRLQHVPRLDVKSRYEVRRMRGTTVTDARSAGRDLRVAWLVTGSVRPSPSRMRVSYELVRASDGRTVVSDIIDTTAADQWAISSTVSTRIARSVAGELAPTEDAALSRGPRDAQAVDLYRRGMFLYNRGIVGNRFDALMSIGFFQSAIERDSSYADAWAGMANAWEWLDAYFPNRVAAERGRRAGNRALALDSTSAGAPAVIYAMTTVDYDWAAAERLGRRAIELSPHSGLTHAQLSTVFAAVGRPQEALSELQQAWLADSLDPGLGWYVNVILLCARRYQDLQRWLPRLPPKWHSDFSLLALGQLDSLFTSTRGPTRAMALAAAGRMEEARSAVRQAQATYDSLRAGGDIVGDEDALAMAWASVGDLDHAFASLERSYQVRSGEYLMFIKVWPFFDPLRNDPRYHDLLRRMHLEP